MKKSRFSVTQGDTLLSPETVLDAYLYGAFFHQQPEHVKALKHLEDFPVHVHKIILYDTLADLTEIVLQLGNFIAYGFENDYFDISEPEDA